ncbi:MAG: hypothetical protein HRT61_19975 [Ekhidna sp.]|nr:hypothetical protein [Ekhidna sp.]
MNYNKSRIVEISETGEIAIDVPLGYPLMTVSIETYTVPVGQENLDYLTEIGEYGGTRLKEEKEEWWQEAGMTGAVTFLLQPPNCIRTYSVPDSEILLSDIDFFSISVQVSKVVVNITTPITGCTHLALNINCDGR